MPLFCVAEAVSVSSHVGVVGAPITGPADSNITPEETTSPSPKAKTTYLLPGENAMGKIRHTNQSFHFCSVNFPDIKLSNIRT